MIQIIISMYVSSITADVPGRGEESGVRVSVHILFLQPVKPRWPCICICMYMVRVGVRFRVCHDMFRTRSSMFNRLRK